MLCRERQQEAAQEAEGCRCRAKPQRMNRFLGRPSVGGRLTAGGSRNEQEYTGTVCRPPTAVRVELRSKCDSSSARFTRPDRPSCRLRSLVCRCCSNHLCNVEHGRTVNVFASSVPSAALAALRSTAAPRSGSVLAPANTPAQSSVSPLRLPECPMHQSQASNPSIERTCQRPLRTLWPAAHVERWAPVGEAGYACCAEVEAGACSSSRSRRDRICTRCRSRSYLGASAAGLSVRLRPAHRRLCAQEIHWHCSRLLRRCAR